MHKTYRGGRLCPPVLQRNYYINLCIQNNLSVRKGNTNIASACPIGKRIELNIPSLIESSIDSIK